MAILRAVPNMTVVAPADAEEMRRLMPATLNHHGPLYIRLAKGGDPIVTRPDSWFEIGKIIPMREGRDAVIVSTGVMLKPALDAAGALASEGLETTVLHAHTVKPLDVEALLRAAASARAIVSVEEHTVVGGLGSAVAEVVAEAGFTPAKRFKRLGIPDVFAAQYGSQASLMESYALTAGDIAATVRRLCDKESTRRN